MLRYLGLLIIILSLVGIMVMAIATIQKPQVILSTGRYPAVTASMASNIGGNTYFVFVLSDLKSIQRTYADLPYKIIVEVTGSPLVLNTPIETKLVVVGTYLPVPQISGAVKSSTMKRFLSTINANKIVSIDIVPGHFVSLRISQDKIAGYKHVYLVLIYVCSANTLVRDFNVIPQNNMTSIGEIVDSAVNGSWSANGVLSAVFKTMRIYYVNNLAIRVKGYLELSTSSIIRATALASVGLVLILIDYIREPEKVKEMFSWVFKRRRPSR